MENRRIYENLDFKTFLQRRNQRLVIFIVSIFGYLLIMWIVPTSVLVILLLFVIPPLIWVSTYGWRTALNQIIRYLQRFLIN